MTINEILSEHVVEMEYEDIPIKVTEHAKDIVLDLVGDILGGYLEPGPQQVISAIKDFDEGSQTTILGDGSKVSSPYSAFANTASAEGNDFTPGTTGIVPTAISVGEKEKSDGKTIITAVVAGYEIAKRVIDCMDDPTLQKNGFYWPQLSIGTAVTAGKILNLNKDQMVWAIGNAGSSGTAAWIPFAEGLRSKLLFHGMAATTGIFCCYLAKHGFEGPRELFETTKKANFFELYSRQKYDPSKATSDLDEYTIDRNVLFKLYPTCRATHSSIDAAYEIVKNNEINYEDISEIMVRLPDRDASLVGIHPKVESKFDAQFSLHFLLASVIIRKIVPTLDLFAEENIKDHKINNLASKVKVIGDPELTKIRTYPSAPYIHPSRLIIKTKDGKEYKAEINQFKGTPNNPTTRDELRFKFESQAKLYLPKEQVNEIFSLINNLENLEDISELVGLLYVKK